MGTLDNFLTLLHSPGFGACYGLEVCGNSRDLPNLWLFATRAKETDYYEKPPQCSVEGKLAAT